MSRSKLILEMAKAAHDEIFEDSIGFFLEANTEHLSRSASTDNESTFGNGYQVYTPPQCTRSEVSVETSTNQNQKVFTPLTNVVHYGVSSCVISAGSDIVDFSVFQDSSVLMLGRQIVPTPVWVSLTVVIDNSLPTASRAPTAAAEYDMIENIPSPQRSDSGSPPYVVDSPSTPESEW
ncbi:hypothetical protein RN001_005184 [Aquatica leii]|uniref:Uncharacterized protein n=1 Tax=Aquatica leii TaxID=1421715 RepID=A0AAN7SS07_9COLE|nr:hypothetical protein RN001_005184 [Aquatica leii]